MGTFGVVVYIGCDLCVCRPVWRLVCNRGYILGCVGSEPEPGALPYCTEHETPHVVYVKRFMPCKIRLLCSGVVTGLVIRSRLVP